jgi:hypothetical protein
MNKIVASVGLVALGASAVQIVSGQGLETATPQKPWNVSAALRGFYDDNPGTVGSNPQGTFGFDVSPAVALAWSLQQTSISLDFLYDLKYYDRIPQGSTSHEDQSFTFNLALTHAFSERYHGSVRDGFVIGQEPDLLRAGSLFSTYQRVSGSNIRNYGALSFDGELTRELGFEIGYDNGFYDYADTGGTAADPSLGGTLNRLEHYIHLDGRWKLAPETTAILGYQFAQTGYTANEPIGLLTTNGPAYYSNARNSYSHYAYVGLDNNFSSALTAAFRVGARYIDFYNNPYSTSGNVTPYASLSVRYTYARESYAELGGRYDRNSTDITGSDANSLTTDETSGTIYGNLSHHFTPKLVGGVTAQIQDSTFNGGPDNGKNEIYYLAGLNLEYRFNLHLAADVGYNYDKLDSSIGRSFDRNRVYLGITASY